MMPLKINDVKSCNKKNNNNTQNDKNYISAYTRFLRLLIKKGRKKSKTIGKIQTKVTHNVILTALYATTYIYHTQAKNIHKTIKILFHFVRAALTTKATLYHCPLPAKTKVKHPSSR